MTRCSKKRSVSLKNRFLLSVLLAKRVAQLRRGAEPLVPSQSHETPEEIVFREIIEEKLEWRKTASALDLTDMDQGFHGCRVRRRGVVSA